MYNNFKNKPQCMRCGSCCCNYICVVPKNEDSNLSKEFIEKLEKEKGFEYCQEYINNNSIPQGKQCKWLTRENYIAKCTAYERRCSMCTDYESEVWCNIGLMYWCRHKKKGLKIPDEIMEIIKQHPLYETMFDEEG